MSFFTQASPWGNSYIRGVEVTTENNGVTTVCNNLNSWPQSQVWREVACSNEIVAEKIHITIKSSGITHNSLCKISIFAPDCKLKAYTVTEDAWAGATTTFDLLKDTSKTIAVPTLTISPVGCYVTTWTAHKQADNANVVSTMSSVFSFATSSGV